MKDYIIWLDSESAHVFALNSSGEGVEKSVVKKNDADHHNRHKKDQHQDSHAEPYYRDLAAQLKDADKMLLIGPGLAKNHFRDHLNTHQAHTLAKKVIGLENFEGFEHKTENQMMAEAHKFFKTYDLFNRPV